MKHLEFALKLNELGCSFRSTNVENKVKTIEISNIFGESQFVEIKNFQCNWTKDNLFSKCMPLKAVIREAIDIDSWKHSYHTEIIPENFEKFREIIQDKLLRRAKEMDFLTTVYFQLNHEISNAQQTK